MITFDVSAPNGTVETNLTFDGSVLNIVGRIIASASTTDDLVRISNTGTGNALVVEDSTNPDSTPFVINSAGSVAIGATSTNYKLDVIGDTRLAGNIYGTNSKNTIISDALIQAGLLFLSNNC